MTNINLKNIIVLSALDKLISEHKANSTLFCSIFQQKEAILGLLQSGKMDANKYKVFVAKAFKEQSGIVKACAEEDFNKLKDPKNPKLLQLWFRQITETTYANYQKQQKLYKHYQSQITASTTAIVSQPRQGPPPATVQKPKEIKQVPQPPKPSGMNMEQLVSFKVLDSMMEQQNSLEKFQNLLERKNKLLGYVARKQMSPERYKAVLQMFCNRLNGTQLASDYKFELDGINDFHEGNISEWFKQIYEQTKDVLSQQNEKLAKLKKGPLPQKKVLIQQKNIVPSRQSVKLHQTKHTQHATKLSFNIGELNCFKVFDEKLEEQSDNKKNYKEVLEKKKKFIQMVKKGQLTAQKYRSLLIKCISQAKDEQIKETMQFQLSQLKQFHDNNLASWFNDIFSNAQLMIQDQEKDLVLLEQGKKIKKKDNSDDDIDMKFLNGEDDDDGQDIKFPGEEDDQPDILKPQPKKSTAAKKQMAPSPAISKSNEFSDIFSLKYLDQLMEESSSTQQFCLCFERKQALFGMMQKGQINAQKYKVLQEKCLSTTNSKLRDCIEMDLYDLKDMCSGNVDQWFQSLINDTGFNFQDQQDKYQKIKAGKGGSNPPVSQQKQAPQPLKEGLGIKQKPNINELVSFSALIKLIQHSVATVDILYYGQLVSKRTKLIDLVTQNRLTPPKYKQINKTTAGKTENTFLKECILEEFQLLKSQFKQNEEQWFQALKQCLNEPLPELKLPENPQMKRVNSLSLKSKLQYLAKRMAPYESLIAYYSSNKLPIQQNSFVLNYTKTNRKQGLQIVTLLSKNPQMDLYNLVEQLFPPFNAEIFFGGNLISLKKKAEASTSFFAQEIAVLKDYASKIKKATNPQNLQNTKKQIAQCQENIAYLKSWPGKELTPFPVITQQKTERFNLDLNTHLDNNQVEVIINNLNGIDGQLMIKIYAGNAPNERYWTRVKNGPQGNMRTIIKLPSRQMFDLMKGDRPVIAVRFFQKNFFGSLKLVSQCGLIGVFIRNNIAEEVAQAGSITVNYQLRVYKPTKPLITQFTHTTIKIQPAFKIDPSQQALILKELLAKQ